uniref:Transposase n=1 Tax=Heterorhabditis bacteriophora TaxID=37862 RepID=A0A1I7WU79_HETBA
MSLVDQLVQPIGHLTLYGAFPWDATACGRSIDTATKSYDVSNYVIINRRNRIDRLLLNVVLYSMFLLYI